MFALFKTSLTGIKALSNLFLQAFSNFALLILNEKSFPSARSFIEISVSILVERKCFAFWTFY